VNSISGGWLGQRFCAWQRWVICRGKATFIHRRIHRCGKRVERRKQDTAKTYFPVDNGESGFRGKLCAARAGAHAGHFWSTTDRKLSRNRADSGEAAGGRGWKILETAEDKTGAAGRGQ